MASEDDKTDDEVWVDLRPAAAVAQIFTFVALMIYVWHIVPQCLCTTFTVCFFRQVAYIFQTIRLFLLMAALLPCVMHGQVRSMLPKVTGGYFAGSVLLALLGNILAAIGIRKFFECNRDSLVCLWRWLPCNRSCCPPPPPPCCRCCGLDPNQCYPQPTSKPKSYCEPSCCPKPRRNRPRRTRNCPDPKLCCPKSPKPKCRKTSCTCPCCCE